MVSPQILRSPDDRKKKKKRKFLISASIWWFFFLCRFVFNYKITCLRASTGLRGSGRRWNYRSVPLHSIPFSRSEWKKEAFLCPWVYMITGTSFFNSIYFRCTKVLLFLLCVGRWVGGIMQSTIEGEPHKFLWPAQGKKILPLTVRTNNLPVAKITDRVRNLDKR